MRKPILHAILGTAAILIIATFWISTLISELFLSHDAVVIVKHSIVHYGLAVLVLTMFSLAASGNLLAGDRKGRIIEAKKKRMPILAINAILVMIPSAIFLSGKAAARDFDMVFYAVQVLELAVGLVQLTLLGLNFRDGLIISGRLRPRMRNSQANN